MTDTVIIIQIVVKCFEFISIISVQAVKGANPYEPFAILKNAGYVGLRQPMVCGEMTEAKILVQGISGDGVEKGQ